MSKSSPFIRDRSIPLYPGLACFLDFLPGIDPDTARRRTNKDTGKVSQVSMTTRGIIRSLVLTQLDHRLRDNPADRDLLIRDGVAWYARSYESWHYWDFRMFMSQPTMKRAFQDLAAAGYILTRKQTDFITPDLPLNEANAIKKIMHVYNGLAWSIDYDRLEAAMADNPEVQAYYARMESRAANTSDQPDQTTSTSDQPDQTPRISLIRQVGSERGGGSDQPDPTSGISLIRHQQSLDQNQDQRSAEIPPPSAAPPLEPASGMGDDLTENRQALPALVDDQIISYARLTAIGVQTRRAQELARTRTFQQITAWLDYIRQCNAPGSTATRIKSPAGYVVEMLKNPENMPRNGDRPEPADGSRFLAGEYGDEINH
jgi:hypothetical protein